MVELAMAFRYTHAAKRIGYFFHFCNTLILVEEILLDAMLPKSISPATLTCFAHEGQVATFPELFDKDFYIY